MSDPDIEDYGNPHAIECELYCACGRAYRGMAVPHDRSYDSPGWNEPEPGEEKCPTCREEADMNGETQPDEYPPRTGQPMPQEFLQ